jgi:hypothetical protein
MFRIACFVGSKLGGWHPGSKRYPDHGAAQREIDSIARAEERCDCTKILRRVVRG